jgi:hypothetical protein
MKCSLIVLCVTILLSAISLNELDAFTWHVPATVSTIKHAVEDSAAYGDTVLVAPGIYDTTSGENFPINMKNGVVLISESGASLTIVNASATGSVISCNNCDQSTEICGFTITGGRALNGGGIYCVQSYLTIRDNIINNNTALSSTGGGGGIYCANSDPTIMHNQITENTSQNRFGGGIYSYFSYAVIAGNAIAHNTSMWGGGIFNDNSSPTIQHNTIKGNHSILSGGGLDCYMNSSPYIIGNVIVGNSSGTDGAGIACCYSCAPYICYNTIACNVGDFGGGVRSLGNSSPTVVSNIIVDNVDALYLNADSDVMFANDNSIYCNSYQPNDYEVVNNTSSTINITNNFWWVTDAPSIAALINGPANFEPFQTSPAINTPNEPSSVTSVTAMTDSTYTAPLTSNLHIGDTIYIQLIGADWHSGLTEPALVIMKTTQDPYGIALALIETDSATGIYQGWACVSDTSNDALNHIGAHTDDTLIITSHVDITKSDTVFIGTIGIREHKVASKKMQAYRATIVRGPLPLTDGARVGIYDITGRQITSHNPAPGIYFVETEDKIISKIVVVR